jgi:hypothetical protein
MSSFPGPANPIFYSQFRIRGGWRNIGIFSGAYAAIIGGLIWFTASSAEPRHYTDALLGWLDGLLGLQVFLLLLFGSSRVSSTVRADVTGKIIESHRLMPLSAFSAVVGYVTGPPIQAICLAIVNFLLGLFAAEGAGIEIQRWMVANGMLAAFVLLIWIVTAQLAFTIRGGFLLLVIVISIALFSSGGTMVLLPALSVLTCPILARSVFDLRASVTNVTFPYASAIVAQFIIGAVCFSAAMRKYRLPDASGFNVPLGLLLLAAWTAISLVGIRFSTEFMPNYYYRTGMRDLETTQFIASIVVAMLLAILPIASSARANDEYHRYAGPTSTHRRPLPTYIVCLLSTAVICLFPSLHPRLGTTSINAAFVHTAVIVLASVAAIGFLLRWAYRVRSKPGVILLIWVALVWIVPLVGDTMYRALSEKTDAGIISTLSPIGALIASWNDRHFLVIPGIVFQCGMVLLPATLYILAANRKPKKITVPDGPAPALS